MINNFFADKNGVSHKYGAYVRFDALGKVKAGPAHAAGPSVGGTCVLSSNFITAPKLSIGAKASLVKVSLVRVINIQGESALTQVQCGQSTLSLAVENKKRKTMFSKPAYLKTD